jgi:hypothetical protein
MKFLYSAKGCSHCDNRGECTKKNSESNLTKESRKIEEMKDNLKRTWETLCRDFTRSNPT